MVVGISYPVRTKCVPTPLHCCAQLRITVSTVHTFASVFYSKQQPARIALYCIAWNNDFRKIFNEFCRESVKSLLFYCVTYLTNLNKLLCWKRLMVFDNPIVRWLATRRKDNMYALACKLNVDCDLLVTSRREVKSRLWQCFERSIGGYL